MTKTQWIFPLFMLFMLAWTFTVRDVIIAKESGKHYSGFNMALMQEGGE